MIDMNIKVVLKVFYYPILTSYNHIFCLYQKRLSLFVIIIQTRVFYWKIYQKIKQNPGPEWFIFHNLTREFTDDVILVISLYYFIDVILSI